MNIHIKNKSIHYLKNKQKVATKSIIKVLYIEHFYLNDQRQNNFSLLCINFFILHCKSKF
jgi:hypothetical protein